MKGAAFLLLVNLTIGLAFAAAYFALARDDRKVFGNLCGLGFLAASGVAFVESLAPISPVPRVISGLSAVLLITALTLIVTGIAHQYRAYRAVPWLWTIFVAACVLHLLVIPHIPRDSLFHAVGYQAPFALMAGIGGVLVLTTRGKRIADWALSAVLLVASVQFLLKSLLAATITTGSDVASYITSTYAQISQTAGAIISLLLGLSLLMILGRAYVHAAVKSARFDALSGLKTRSLFHEEADLSLRQANGPFCLVLCDLDHFKHINDHYGHGAGDEVIARFGRLLKEVAGEAGICGRIGGEEFAVLLRPCEAPGAEVFVGGVQASLAQCRFSMLPEHVQVSASFGIAAVGRGEALVSVMRRADFALYAAKNGGRDCYRIAG